MSDKTYPVPAEWKKRAFIDDAAYRKMYAESVSRRTSSGPNTPSGSTGSSRRRRSRTPPTPIRTSRSNGSRTASSMSPVTASTATEEARRPDRDHLGRRRSLLRQEDHLSRAPRACLPVRQCAEEARRQEGRPRHHLHADDPRSGLCDARLRAHRRSPFGGVRRLLARIARRPHRGLPNRNSSSPPTKVCVAAARCRSRPIPMRRSKQGRAATRKVLVVRRTGGAGQHGGGPRHLVSRRGRRRYPPNARPKR